MQSVDEQLPQHDPPQRGPEGRERAHHLQQRLVADLLHVRVGEREGEQRGGLDGVQQLRPERPALAHDDELAALGDHHHEAPPDEVQVRRHLRVPRAPQRAEAASDS